MDIHGKTKVAKRGDSPQRGECRIQLVKKIMRPLFLGETWKAKGAA